MTFDLKHTPDTEKKPSNFELYHRNILSLIYKKKRSDDYYLSMMESSASRVRKLKTYERKFPVILLLALRSAFLPARRA